MQTTRFFGFWKKFSAGPVGAGFPLLFGRVFSRKLPHDVQRAARRKLEILDAAETLDDLRKPPANRLEKLHGKPAGQHSIRINDQRRLCFVWREDNAYDVEIVDYH